MTTDPALISSQRQAFGFIDRRSRMTDHEGLTDTSQILMAAPEHAAQAVPSLPGPAMDRWKAWDDFLETTPETGFMQSSWWADFRTNAGFELFGTVLKDRNGIGGGAMVQKLDYSSQSCFYYVQDGPALPSDDLIAAEVFDTILEAIEERRRAGNQTVSHLASERNSGED